MFIMDLSVSMNIPAHEIRQWPIEEIDRYRAYNSIKPFTKSVDQWMVAKVVEYIRNQNVTKEKDWVGSTELFKFLNHELPESFEHEDVREFKKAIKHFPMLHEIAREEILGDMNTKVYEEFKKGSEGDMYVIHMLRKLIQENKKHEGS